MAKKKSVQEKRTPAQVRKTASERVDKLVKSRERANNPPRKSFRGVPIPGKAPDARDSAAEQKALGEIKKRQRNRNAGRAITDKLLPGHGGKLTKNQKAFINSQEPEEKRKSFRRQLRVSNQKRRTRGEKLDND